ncbi:hypothetical protein B0H10DRAFT_1939269 [Mycena sp. CBHHK59/15]|nr:hypothetical protein B0H10DRAFT_1939269 [Mycena sp. CBHHK59/15]
MAPNRNTHKYYKLDKFRPGPDRNRCTSQTTTRQQDLGFTQHDPTPQQPQDAHLHITRCKRQSVSSSGFLESSRKEVRTSQNKSKSAKPPENQRSTEKPADTSLDWRTKAMKGRVVDEGSDEAEGVPVARKPTSWPRAQVVILEEDESDEEDAISLFPFKNVPPVGHSNGKRDNILNKPREPNLREKKEPEYRVRAPYQREDVGRALLERIRDTKIEVSIGEQLAVSPELAGQFKKSPNQVQSSLFPGKSGSTGKSD